MSNLGAELLLRLVKPAFATALAAVVFLVAIALGEPASATLALVAWLAGAVLVLLIQEGPL